MILALAEGGAVENTGEGNSVEERGRKRRVVILQRVRVVGSVG